ncbi:MAG TPA: TIGR03067 domain-containing protein [Isosphaeraceae bacterium]|nr:TIGR03067 domain-containing protein [Isosphaeraceae bacterium]
MTVFERRIATRAALLIATLALLTARPPASASPDSDKAKSDLDRLQGSWTCVSMERNGKPIPPESYKDGLLVMDGDTFTYTQGKQLVSRGKRVLHPETNPKGFDDQHSEGRFKGKTYFGIYEIQGDQFKTCNGSLGQERPKAFETKPGTGLLLIVYKRMR